MLYAFIDESYTADRYYVAAVVVKEEHLGTVSRALTEARAYAKTFGVDEAQIEFHAHALMTGRSGWEPVRGKTRAALAIYRDALTRMARLPATLIIRGVDIPRLHARYRYPQRPHELTLRHLLERIDDLARSRGDVVTVIADEIQDQADHIARAAWYQQNGTGGSRSSRLAQIQMPIVFGSSAESPGIQLADLAVYLYRRLDAHTETHPRTAREVERLWKLLQPICRHASRWDP
ncbi:DUF3800 domain-containing protein [Microbacterium sp. MEC084]|uniref:DUF3800 domain-containing protein n=1 Tax=unclassified Microbacterium TaxID=2609290 RepID=UPI0006F91547|nr:MULTISPECIES: DUF3800 domain-containing protein [unclassified Microbacterium]KQY98636.1 hypothetical protein ASD19_07350 [Microbacterium sp. Root53]MCD1269206.1 DUF3800 domain-containing protein [Microbacterium sp. MEC084]